jgi:hypothetical protein
MKTTANHIKALLAHKHRKDVFATEVNLGSAWANCRRMDAWAMKRTWAPITTIGYEIKVSRADFLRDDKWPEYLDHCGEFYFVCPHGMISTSEIPPGVGLIVTTKAGDGLRTARRATRHGSGLSQSVAAYLLMNRATITASRYAGANYDEVTT